MSAIYPIVILTSKGLSLSDALAVVRWAQIRVEGASEISSDGKAMATILLRTPEDRNKALRTLYKAGFDVKEGPAGF
jgi:hypothetical protein